MFLKLPKRITLISILLIGLKGIAYSQDFYKDYQSFLYSREIIVSDKYRKTYIKSVDTSIKRLRIATDHFEQQTHHSFFNADTVYMVRFSARGGDDGEIILNTTVVIWDVFGSCSYNYSYYSPNGKRESHFEIKTDAKDILNGFTKKFLETLALMDTAFYHNYANAHSKFYGGLITTVGVNSNKSWKFTDFAGDGSSLCFGYDVDARLAEIKKKSPITLSNFVDGIIRKNLHFNIDSVKIAYRTNPDIYNNKQPFPLILLNNNPVTFEYLEKVNLNEVKAISILNNKADCIAIFGEIGKYGVVTITTNGKKTY